jgi:hypothetical protein
MLLGLCGDDARRHWKEISDGDVLQSYLEGWWTTDGQAEIGTWYLPKFE